MYVYYFYFPYFEISEIHTLDYLDTVHQVTKTCVSQWQSSTKAHKEIREPSIQVVGRNDGTGISLDARILVGYLTTLIVSTCSTPFQVLSGENDPST